MTTSTATRLPSHEQRKTKVVVIQKTQEFLVEWNGMFLKECDQHASLCSSQDIFCMIKNVMKRCKTTPAAQQVVRNLLCGLPITDHILELEPLT